MQRDIVLIKQVGRLLLRRVQMALKTPETISDKTLELEIRRHEQIFGPKNSLAGTLVTISELLLRLNGQGEASQAVAPPTPDEGDVALVEAFVQRMQQAENHEHS